MIDYVKHILKATKLFKEIKLKVNLIHVKNHAHHIVLSNTPDNLISRNAFDSMPEEVISFDTPIIRLILKNSNYFLIILTAHARLTNKIS